MKRLTIVIMLVFLATSLCVMGQDIKFKGLVQSWFSYAQQDAGDDENGYGFTLRRVRFKPYGSFSDKIKWTLQVGWDKQSAKLVDVYLDFIFSKSFQLRVGQYTVPGTISSSLTSSGKLDFVERAAITQKWGGNTGLSSYRSVGLQAYGKLMDDKLYYAVMFANTKTSAIFTPGLKLTDYEHSNNGLLVLGRLEVEFTKGLRMGTFYSTTSETDTDLERSSYGAHFFYVKKGINFKAEYIAGDYGRALKTKYSGLYAVLGYKTGKWEPIVRYDFYTPNDGDPDGDGVKKINNISFGINYYHSKRVKLQANYILRSEDMAEGMDEIKNNLFYVCFQFTY